MPLVTLTPKQAAVFRQERERVLAIFDGLKQLTMELSDVCGHMNQDDPDCPVCWVYRAAANAETAFADAPDHLEGALLRAPLPKSA